MPLFDRGRLAIQRRTPKVPEGFSSGSRGRSIGSGGSAPPYGGIPFGDLPAGLEHDLGLPKHLLAWAFGHVRACPQSSLTLLSWSGCRNLWKAQPSNPWTITGSMPFLSHFFESPSASLGGLLSFWVQEEPPSLRTEREGDQEFSCLFR